MTHHFEHLCVITEGMKETHPDSPVWLPILLCLFHIYIYIIFYQKVQETVIKLPGFEYLQELLIKIEILL